MMMIDGKKITPVYGNMRPVEVRLNHQRLAGWVEESKSGEHVDFQDTYNHYADVVVHGNSVQDGEPTTDASVPVLSAGDCNLVTKTLNIVTNGNFSQGTTGWLGEAGVLTVSNLTAIVVGIGTQSRIRLRQTNLIFQPINEVIYVRCKARVRDSVCTSLYSEFVKTSGSWYKGGHLKRFPEKDVWYDASILITLDASREGLSYLYLQAFYADNATQKDKILEVQDVQVIDLTATFGPGNEPTKEWCDEHFARWQDKKSDSIPLPPLRKKGDVADTYNPATGEYVRRIGVRYIPVTTKWNGLDPVDWEKRVLDYVASRKSGTYSLGFFSHGTALNTSLGILNSIGINASNSATYWYPDWTSMGLIGNEERTFADAKLQEWIAANNPYYTYILATPVTTYFDPAPVPTYYPWTSIEQDGAVKGVIDATTKVIE